MDTLGQTPNGFFASPKTAVAEDAHLVSRGDLVDDIPEDVMPKSGDACHFFGTALEGLVRLD